MFLKIISIFQTNFANTPTQQNDIVLLGHGKRRRCMPELKMDCVLLVAKHPGNQLCIPIPSCPTSNHFAENIVPPNTHKL